MRRKLPIDVIEKLNDQRWLYQQHVEQLFSIVEISKQLNVTANVVRKALRKFAIQSPPQQALREASNKRKYGVCNPGQVSEFRKKAQNTLLQKYGGHNWAKQNRMHRDLTCLIKYGDTNVAKTDYGKQKVKETNLQKYNRFHKKQIILSDEQFELLNNKQWLYEQHIENYKTIAEIAREINVSWDVVNTALQIHNIPTQQYTHKLPGDVIKLLNNREWLHHQNKELKKSATEIAKELDVDPWTVARHFKQQQLIIELHPVSFGQKQLSTFLQQHYINVIENDRTIISPQEIDIYLPDYKIAIEYCGLYWHSERFKGRLYHRNKMLACNERGIRLLTIYENEWVNDQEIVKNKLLSILKLNKQKTVYSRKSIVVEMSKQQKKQFFDTYHIQHDGPGSICYGLHDGTNIVAAMCFIKYKDQTFVLNRYATSCHVPGGFTKLLEHFKRNHQWREIISFADLRWSEGKLYKQTGFTVDKILPPDYQYIINNKPIHKFNFRRKFLQKRLKYFDPNLSESQNCKNNNIDRIWDCGKIRFVLKNQSKQ